MNGGKVYNTLNNYINNNVIKIIQEYLLFKNNKNHYTSKNHYKTIINNDIKVIQKMDYFYVDYFYKEKNFTLKEKIKYYVNENKYNKCNCKECKYYLSNYHDIYFIYLWAPENLHKTNDLKRIGWEYHYLFHHNNYF